MSKSPLKHRGKRGTFLPPGERRTRKEYRMMGSIERDDYHFCMNKLKTTPTDDGDTTRYDAIASIHNSLIADAAHGGVAFLCWHRVYLYTLENALRDVDPRCSQVTLPYWDCSAEYYADLMDPGSGRHSILFSEEYAGNGDGDVTTGNFKDWGLVRNVANGELFGREIIEEMKAWATNDDIASPWNYYSIELYHNSIHRFLGGFLLDITNAPRDPLFFMLHTYIDYIWEACRQAMIQRGLDPSEYPSTNDRLHRGSTTMPAFPDWTNKEGYSALWYERNVRYDRSFDCNENTCQHVGLTCQAGRCRSTRYLADNTSPTNEWWLIRKRRDVSDQYDVNPTTRPQVQTCTRYSCPNGESSLQNTFLLNDVIDADLWVYITVGVIYERSGGLQFNSYYSHPRSQHSHFDHGQDIFDPSRDDQLTHSLYTGEARPYDSCRVNGAGSAKVFIRADGVNYSGNSMEYAIIDERLPLTSAKAYVPVKDPTHYDTEVCLIAYDDCGRICLPICRVEGLYPPMYEPCTGCIRVNNGWPRMYRRTIAEVIANQWTFQKSHHYGYLYPTDSDTEVFLKFLCDASSKLPWQRLGNHY